jgi:hypothetical protein
MARRLRCGPRVFARFRALRNGFTYLVTGPDWT